MNFSPSGWSPPAGLLVVRVSLLLCFAPIPELQHIAYARAARHMPSTRAGRQARRRSALL
jgi:hypothetical protein